MNEELNPISDTPGAADASALSTPELQHPQETTAYAASPPKSGPAVSEAPADSQPTASDAAEPPATATDTDTETDDKKLDAQSALHLHTPKPAVTRLKPKAVGLLLLAAAGAVGVALVIGLGGSPPVPQTRQAQNSDVSVQPSSDTADDNPLLGSLPKTYTWSQSYNHHVDHGTATPGGPTTGIANVGNSPVPTAQELQAAAQERQRLQELKSLQRQWRQAMNSPEVFPGMADAIGDHPLSKSPSSPSGVNPDATGGPIGSSGILPFGQAGVGEPNAPAGSGANAQNGGIQQQHQDFMRQARTVEPYLAQPLASPVSPYEIQAGAVIPGALVTGINSDLPGQIIGMVTQNVFDSVTGKYLLIPQGSRLLGRYSSVVGNGENRVLIAWQRLILPNGDSIVLDAMPGTDQEGQSGLHDKVDYHFKKLAEAAALSTAIAYGGNLAINPNSTSTNQDVVGSTIAQESSQIGQKIIERQLDVQPTITIRPGWPFRVLVNRDVVLKPYKP